jgi:copper homeostasis protein
MKHPVFELCAPSLLAARAAERGGADRIELCTDLSVGGVTPAPGLVASVVQAISIPVRVLIRPRAGDFVYSRDEFELICRQIEAAKSAGADGVVIGVLLPDSRVDVARSRALAKLARPMMVTFHRAFDETTDPEQALEDVLETGADCVLTSGGAPDVMAGAECLARLRQLAGTRVEIMAGGGLRLENLDAVVRRTGVTSLHGSMTHDSGGASFPDADLLEGSVRAAVKLLRYATADLNGHPA